MNRLFPIFLKLEGRPCLVVGGGAVALEKIPGLLEAGAELTVVAERPRPELEGLAAEGRLTLLRRRYRDTDLEGQFLVMAATDDEDLHRRIADQAEARGMLCNIVDRPPLCNFYAGSVLRQGDLKIAISTNGQAPALAARIRSRLERQFGPGYARVLEYAGCLRALLRERWPDDSAARMDTMRRAFEDEALLEALEHGDEAALEKMLEDWVARWPRSDEA